jgi:hypothetical protein
MEWARERMSAIHHLIGGESDARPALPLCAIKDSSAMSEANVERFIEVMEAFNRLSRLEGGH